MPGKQGNEIDTERGVETNPVSSLRRFYLAGWLVDANGNQLSRDGTRIRLEPKAMELLVYLVGRAGEVVSRSDIERAVWANSVVGYDALTNEVRKLRKAMGDDARHPHIIETLSKRGYRLIASVRPMVAENAADERKSNRSAALWGAVALLALLLIGGLSAWLYFAFSDKVTWSDDGVPKSIVVLPFEHLGTDPRQSYFADGITDDLTAMLARNAHLLVIARDSAFMYRGASADMQAIAARLNVRYLLSGEVRRAGDQVEIAARLLDGPSGQILWAARYSSGINALFEMREDIAGHVIGALEGRVSKGENQDLGRPDTRSPQAYDLFLNGRQRFYQHANREENRKARQAFDEALAFDPEFAMAHAMAAWTHVFDVINGWSEQPEVSLRQAQAMSARAIALREDLPLAHFVTGLAHRERGNHAQALEQARRAIELDPNYANAHVLLATLLYYTGRPAEGLARIKKAMQLNPHHPYNYLFHLGQAYFILGRYAEAIEAFNRGIASNPAAERLRVWLAVAYALTGRDDDAEWQAEQVLSLNPQFSMAHMRRTLPFQKPEDRDRFLLGLYQAGLLD